MKGVARVLLMAVVAGLAGYVAWDRVEAYRLGRQIDAIAARGEPVDLSYRDAPLASPQQRDAAQLYAEAAAAAAQTRAGDYRLPTIDFDSVSGVSVPPADVEQTFRLDCPALQLLDRASTLPFGGMGEFAPEYYYENGASLETLSGLSALRADILTYRGEPDVAADALVSALSVQRTLPGLFYRQVAGARVFGSLRILLRHGTPSAAALGRLQKAFEALPDDDGLEQAVRERRAAFIARLDDPVEGLVPRVLTILVHPYLTHLARQQLEGYEDVSAALRRPWPGKAQMLAGMAAQAVRGARGQGGNAWQPRFMYPDAAVFAADYRSAGLNLAIRRAAIAALGVERYRRAHDGDAPASLAALVPDYLGALPADPFSGAPLVYRRAPDAYLVYSVDVNGRDDGGALYGFGSREPVAASMKPTRDFGIRVPLVGPRGTQ